MSRAIIGLTATVLVWCFVLVSPIPSSAQPCAATVYFGNGMLTDQELAKTTRDKLRTEVNKALVSKGRPELPPGCFDYAYASTKDSGVAFVTDLLEAVFQKAFGLIGPFWQWLAGGVDPSNKFESIIQDLFVGFGNVSYVFNSDLQDHIIKYRDALATEAKLVIVAHSQGNLFANEAYAVLTTGADGLPRVADSKISIVSVATPDHFVAGGGPHTTLYGDAILGVPLRLSANTDIDGTPCVPILINPQAPGLNSTRCHSFVDSYLKGALSRPKILSDVLNALPAPRPFDDNFNDNLLNSALWRLQDGIVGTVEETNHRLEMRPSGPAGTGVGVVSKWLLAGDFDVQVDYILVNWPAGMKQSVQIRAADLATGPFGPVALSRYSDPAGERYIMNFGSSVVPIATVDNSGTLRLVRTGSTLSGYVRSGSNWQLIGSNTASNAATRISVEAGPASFGLAKIAFDNFKVNVGSPNVPEPPSSITITLDPVDDRNINDLDSDLIADTLGPQNDTLLRVFGVSGPSAAFRAAMEFDVSAIPLGAIVTSATLSLHDVGATFNPPFTISLYGYIGDGLISVGDGNAITPFNFVGSYTNDSDTGNPDYVIDVKSFIQYYVDHNEPFAGVLLRSSGEGGLFGGNDLASSEFGDLGARPRLLITYSLP